MVHLPPKILRDLKVRISKWLTVCGVVSTQEGSEQFKFWKKKKIFWRHPCLLLWGLSWRWRLETPQTNRIDHEVWSFTDSLHNEFYKRDGNMWHGSNNHGWWQRRVVASIITSQSCFECWFPKILLFFNFWRRILIATASANRAEKSWIPYPRRIFAFDYAHPSRPPAERILNNCVVTHGTGTVS